MQGDAPKVATAPPPPVQEPRPMEETAVTRIWAPQAAPQPVYDAPAGRPAGFTIAGALLLVAGVIAIATGVYDISLANSVDAVATEFGVLNLSGYVLCCGALMVLFGAASAAGGYFTLIQQRWTIALVCAILAMLSVGPYFICFLLGLIALIFIAAGRDEFLT